MNGILVIDKQAGMTSHDVVAKARRILRTRKIGHTGTLDPFATGVLVLMVGSATRLARFIDKDEKEYLATLKLGFATDTGDLTGKAVGRVTAAVEAARIAAASDWERVLERFRGQILQTPPMYSAKKVDGLKLYELARKGVEIERTAVTVTISELELISADGDELRIRVVCSAGTYVRTLAEDIAKAAGIGAHLTDLRRTRAGRFSLAEARALDPIAGLEQPEQALLPIEQAVAHLAAFELTSERVVRTSSGMSTRVFDTDLSDGQSVRMIAPDGRLVAIGRYEREQNLVQPKVVLV